MNSSSPVPVARAANRIHNFTVRYSEAGRDGVLKLRPFFDYAQEVAAVHAEELGVGMKYLREHRLAWMLSRIKFSFVGAWPHFGDRISVETYPQGFERLFALREFIFMDESGSVWATGSSQWILVDLARLRPVSPAAALDVVLPDNHLRERFFTELDKFPIPDEPEIRWSVSVRESGIDVNAHLNNAEYAGWVHDFLASNGRCATDLQTLQVNFLHGVTANATVACYGTADSDRFACGGLSENQPVFQAEGRWR